MDHLRVEANGAFFHVAKLGSGPPLMLLHGWPEFWLTWQPVMERLADRFTLFAPDLRGFGDSDKPAGPWGNAEHASDMAALIDALGMERVSIVGHDVGGNIMPFLARKAADRLKGLFFFDFVHAGVGPRAGTPDRLSEIWYQSFHLLDIAPKIVGATRDNCRAYIGHFLRHWSHRKSAFDDVLEAFVDNFLKPGNLAGGFAYYKGAEPMRMALLTGKVPMPPAMDVPTCVRWGEHDPILLAQWRDRLGELFSNLDCAVMPDVGHFPHREDPDRAASEIAAFFMALG